MNQIFSTLFLSILSIGILANGAKSQSQDLSDAKLVRAAFPTSNAEANVDKRFRSFRSFHRPIFTGRNPIMDSGDLKDPRPSKQTKSPNGWQIGVAPYLYATGITGTVGARGRAVDINASFGDVWKKLDIPLMVVFEARKRRFFSLTDLVWVKLSDERDTPGDIYANRKIGVNLFALDPEIGYRLIDHGKGTFDVLAGVSIWSVETNINVTTGRLPGFDASMRKTWASPIVGVRGNYDITSKFFVSSRFEIGGAGIGADLGTKFYGGIGYRLTPTVALAGGYRLLKVDYDDHNGFLFDTRMNGLVMGAKFSF